MRVRVTELTWVLPVVDEGQHHAQAVQPGLIQQPVQRSEGVLIEHARARLQRVQDTLVRCQDSNPVCQQKF